MTWTDSIKEVIEMSLQALSRAVEVKTVWSSLIHRVTRVKADSTACHTHPIHSTKL